MPRNTALLLQEDSNQEVDEPFYSKMLSYENIKEKTTYYVTMFIELCGIYLMWIILHYLSAHLYVAWCTPMTIIGFLLSPFVVPAPHCQAFRWVIVNGSNHITTMWFTFGTWVAKKIVL
jgi:hypothetical protein